MKVFQSGALWLAATLLFLPVEGAAQSKRSVAAERTRYFRLTLNLKSAAALDGEPGDQQISTEVGVRSDRPGSCRARLTFQVPNLSGGKTKYLELGTKVDCNRVHLEGDGIALSLTLETSRIVRMIKIKGSDGAETEEPLISQRVAALEVKVPLDQTKVVFDSSSNVGGAGSKDDLQMRIELTATELK